ncbi:uncharacterized protein LOC100573675 [Acyrthosiphon pisum]|uniref:Uncharacterized protein n=1 Tax=Acyrthosiphon pisum TaxID=7029 RepID=A0A8R2H967_ACYPI|nr:uncharacterized protein LOC100573675 [Acyrthosiphon pisum]|eukprot:XP_016661699.1 PREDICTED: uncharacterized protein LOC100573675 [Acyrthosiphon pisum]
MFIEDKIKNTITVSPCNRDIHVTCLEPRQSVKKSFSIKMVKRVTTFEWLPERRKCQEFTIMLFSITIWCSMLIACLVKAIEFFVEAKDENSFSNGLVMSTIAIIMAVILWFWIIIFSSIWKRMNMVIHMHKNKNYLKIADDINTAFAV